MTEDQTPPAAVTGRIAEILSEHRPTGNETWLGCTCDGFQTFAVATDHDQMMRAAAGFEAHQAEALAAVLWHDLYATRDSINATALAELQALGRTEGWTDRIGELAEAAGWTPPPVAVLEGDTTGMDPQSEFAQQVAAGQPVNMLMVKPSDCAVFAIVGMDRVANVQAVGVSRPVAGGILRMLADELDPEGLGNEGVSLKRRDVPPITRPDGSPL